MRTAILASLFLAAPAFAADEVKLVPTNLDGLLKAIQAHKGKIVVVDIWGDFCIPCKEKFPHMVELSKKYAKDGVVFISVTIDDPEDKDKALAFLKKQNATFQNFILEDKDKLEKAGDDKLLHSGPPIVHVFDRDGKPIKTYQGKKEAAQLDEQLEMMLKK